MKIENFKDEITYFYTMAIFKKHEKLGILFLCVAIIQQQDDPLKREIRKGNFKAITLDT